MPISVQWAGVWMEQSWKEKKPAHVCKSNCSWTSMSVPAAVTTAKQRLSPSTLQHGPTAVILTKVVIWLPYSEASGFLDWEAPGFSGSPAYRQTLLYSPANHEVHLINHCSHPIGSVLLENSDEWSKSFITWLKAFSVINGKAASQCWAALCTVPWVVWRACTTVPSSLFLVYFILNYDAFFWFFRGVGAHVSHKYRCQRITCRNSFQHVGSGDKLQVVRSVSKHLLPVETPFQLLFGTFQTGSQCHTGWPGTYCVGQDHLNSWSSSLRFSNAEIIST